MESEAQEKTLTTAQIYRIQREIFDAKLEQEGAHEDFISDRTLLDTLVYLLLKTQAEPPPDSVVETLEVLTEKSLKRLDLVCFFPMEELWMPHKDTLRLTERAYASAVDAMIRGFLAKMGVYPIYMYGGTVEERAQKVLEEITYRR